MQMQEPEQQQQWQEGYAHEGYRAEYPAYEYESDQQPAYDTGFAANDYQEQKIYPQPKQRQRGKVLPILGIIFSSTGFFLSLAGIILSSLELQFAHGEQAHMVGGGIGLTLSILLMLICIAIWVFSIIRLTLHSVRKHGRRRYYGF